ncbi:MAG: CGNR zinc finger domain-containing protein [Frankia sp.]|nr:CGNR zinc finger domain-containing protein [Frankia sp.]
MPVAPGVAGALAQIVAAIVPARADGTWQRLKICPADPCAWVFYDRSKNQSRTWCSMAVCGNRAKTQAYRARQSGNRHPHPAKV